MSERRPLDRPVEGPLAGWRHRSWPWLLVVLGVAAPALLWGLGDGTMRVYDEGLYGQLARNALEHGQYLHAVDREGGLYPGFTKPPLPIVCVALSMRVLGVSMLALRLPFALSMLGLVAVAFAWGRRIGGTPMAVAWALCLLSVAASVRWGRVACIEPMLMSWVMLGLWAYHEALVREGGRALLWAAGAGLALALALATKQVVVGIAVVPIVALELWRREGRRALVRVGLAVGPAVIVGAGWLAWMIGRFGDEATELYVGTGVVRRVSGFESGHSARTLNELAQTVAEACEPFPWVLGAAGLVLLVLRRPPSRRMADGALLLPLLLVTTVVVYDNVSQSLLPWYALDVVVPLTAGLGWLVAGVVATGGEPMDDRLALARTTGGALALAVGAVGMLAPVVSQLDAAVLAGVGVIVVTRRPALASIGRGVLLAAAFVAFVAGTLRHPALRSEPGGHEQLMRLLAARGLVDVDVDTDADVPGEYGLGTHYGPQAQQVRRPPWHSDGPAPHAYVTGTQWPLELRADNGSEIVRVPGLIALVGGDLRRPAWGRHTLQALLDAGPITFEAEHMASQRDDARVEDPTASGGVARARVPFAGRGEDMFLLTHGPRIALPKGRYTASFELRWDCGGRVGGRPVAILHVVSGRKSLGKHEVACEGEPDPEGYRPLDLDFALGRSSQVELRVQYVSDGVWHDRTRLRRHD